MPCRWTPRPRSPCSGWPRAADGHFLANQCRAWSEALDPFEYNLFTDGDSRNSGALQVAGAMRADVFQIDCAFYLAGPVGLRRDRRARS